MAMIIVAAFVVLVVGGILRLLLADIGVDPTVCPRCAGAISQEAICPHCHMALGER